MFKKIDDRKELFIGPIPKIITQYGFLAVLLLFGIIVTAATFVRYKRAYTFPVVVTKTGIAAQLSPGQFRQIKQVKTVFVDIPTFPQRLSLEPDFSRPLIEKSVVYVPLYGADSLVRNIRFQNEIFCTGEAVLDNSSLLKKVLKKG